VVEKNLPKKQCTAYAMFLKNVWKSIVEEHPRYSMREVNSVVSSERRIYQEIAKENYEQRIERHNTSHRQS